MSTNLIFLTYFFLLISVLLSFGRNRFLSPYILIILLITALLQQRIQFVGLTWVFILCLLLWLQVKYSSVKSLQVFVLSMVLLASLTLSDHLLPGFNNLLVFDKIKFSEDSIPFSMYLNLDKTLVGILIAFFFLEKTTLAELKKVELVATALTLIAVVALMLPLALATHYIRFDPKLPLGFGLWMINNLFFVCFAEEALFRGFIQGGLTRALPANASSRWFALITGAICFGALHYRGGVPYMAFASIAGIFYGYAYMKTQKLMAPIFVHFGLNLIHLLFFSYPSL